MSMLSKLASALGRRDEVPNQELAAMIAAEADSGAVAELAAAVTGRDSAIASDCIKVLYEIGGRRPDLIAPYADTFIGLLASKNNRLIWGAMTALGEIAPLAPDAIAARIDEVIRANDAGSVITQDWGIRVLAAVCGSDPSLEPRLAPYLQGFLDACIPRDVPKHGESMIPAFTARNASGFRDVLKRREPELKASQMTRYRKVLRALDAALR